MEIGLAHILLLAIIVIGVLALVLATMGSRIKERWDATSMYNVAACLVIASIISCVISFLAVWVALPNNRKVDFTHQDVVVDILSVLVTVLIGWNIFSVVDIKRKAESIDNITSDLNSVISGIIQMSIHSFTFRSDKEAIINSCFNSLKKILECENDKVKSTGVKEIMLVLHAVKCSYKEGEKASVYTNKKAEYEYLLSQIEDVYKEEIKEMLKESNPLGDNDEGVRFADTNADIKYASTEVQNPL